MACETVNLPDGGRAIICGTRQRKRCVSCDGKADQLCDWKVPTRRSGTCDAAICSSCSHIPAPGKDLCPTHRDEWLARQARRKAAA